LQLGSLGSMFLQADSQLKSLSLDHNSSLTVDEQLHYAETYLSSLLNGFVDLNGDEIITAGEMVDALVWRSVTIPVTTAAAPIPVWCTTAETTTRPNTHCYYDEVDVEVILKDSLFNFQFSPSREFDGSGLRDVLLSMTSTGPDVSLSDSECAFWGAKKEVQTMWTTQARNRTADQWFFLRRVCIYTNNAIRKIYNGMDVFDIGNTVATRSFVDTESLIGNRRVHCIRMEYCLGNEGEVCATGQDGLAILYGGYQCSTGVIFVSTSSIHPVI